MIDRLALEIDNRPVDGQALSERNAPIRARA